MFTYEYDQIWGVFLSILVVIISRLFTSITFLILSVTCVCQVTWVVSDSLQPYRVCSPPGFSVHGILQTRILEWVATDFSRGSSWPRDQTCVSYVLCIGRRVLYYWRHLGSPVLGIVMWFTLPSEIWMKVAYMNFWAEILRAMLYLPHLFSCQSNWRLNPYQPGSLRE